MRVLLIEDDLGLQRIIVKRLKEEGYHVEAYTSGKTGLEYAQCTAYDSIILDIMLPEIDGLTILKALRAAGNRAGILLLTARDSVEDRVIGLDAGADDYLVKPFAFEELSARLRTLHRHTVTATPAELQIADLMLDTAAHSVRRAGLPIELTSKEYALLEYLMYNVGRVLTRSQILDHVWTANYGVESNVVDVYIRYLRNKIDRNMPVKLLHTVRGYGYMIKAEDGV